ncbi:MAG: cupin domain-containing protein [Candidatus Thorarchaeota archaeon]
MLKKNYQDIEAKPATLMNGTPVENVFVRWLIDEQTGAKNFAMRRFEIKPGALAPLHNHKEEHEIYILSGKGRFYNAEGREEIAKVGDFLYIPPNEKHGIDNIGEDNLIFLCLIPYLKN